MTHPPRTGSSWTQLKGLVDEALDLPPEQREAFLDEHCGDDGRLRAHVSALLDLELTIVDGKENALSDDFGWIGASTWTGARLGPYRILRELGQGGMGAVYLAERVDGEYEQQVAIKVVGRGPLTQTLYRRFLLERQVLARLNHPHIARLLDGGTTDDGLPYLVMERIEGRGILRYCREEALDLQQKLELFIKVCSTVDFAHRNLVIHRDLKPSNIMVEADGTPKLLDFGIAKLLDDAEEGLTRADQLPGTMGYSSPEQLLGRPVTTAADVYSLGVVLYEMLTEERPFGDTEGAFQAVAKAMKGEKPTAPSQALKKKITASGQAPVGSPTAHDLEGDLDRIVLRAVANEPAERYVSPRDLSDDLQRYLRHEPVSAAPAGFLYLAKKFARRRRGTVIAVALLLLSLIGGLVARSLEARRAEMERQRAVAERAKAEELASFLIQDLWHSLEPMGRLDILAPVSEKLLAYYEDRATEALTLEEQERLNATLEAMAQVLTSSGDSEGGLDMTRRYVEGVRAWSVAGGGSPIERRIAESKAVADLAVAYRETGRHEKSIETFESSLSRLDEHPQTEDPKEIFEIGLLRSWTLDNLGITFFDLGRLEDALEVFSQAEQVLKELESLGSAGTTTEPAGDPADLESELQTVILHLGVVYKDLGRHQQAMDYLDRSVELAERRWAQAPEDLMMLTGLTLSRSVRGNTLRDMGRLTDALAEIEKNRPVLAEVVRKDPGNAELRYQLADTLVGIAKIQEEMGDESGETATWRELLSVTEPLAETTGHIYLLDTHVRALFALDRVEEARPIARRLLDQGWDHQDFRALCVEHGLVAEASPSHSGEPD